MVVLFYCCCFPRVGAASTHTQVQWDQKPKGYVSFDSGILLVHVSFEVLFVLVNVGSFVVIVLVLLLLLALPALVLHRPTRKSCLTRCPRAT